MILIFDFFETLLNNTSIDFNRGLKPLWEMHYKDKCSFEDNGKAKLEMIEPEQHTFGYLSRQ